MRVLDNHQVVDYAAMSNVPAHSKGSVPPRWADVLGAGGGASDTDLPLPRQSAFDKVNSFVDADEYGVAHNTDAIANAIFGDLQARRTSDELVLIEQIFRDVIEGAAMPKVQVVGNGDVYASSQEALLPDGVLGAFVAGEGWEPGTILVSKDILDEPDLLADVMLEEVGEAIGNHVHQNLMDHPDYDYNAPAPGDVGDRIMQVVLGKPVGKVSFLVTDGGLLEDDPDFDPKRDYDERYVMFDGNVVQAKTASGKEPVLPSFADIDLASLTDDGAREGAPARPYGEGATTLSVETNGGAEEGANPDDGVVDTIVDFADDIGDFFMGGSSIDASEAVQADILADNPNAAFKEGFPDLDWLGNATDISVEDLDLNTGPAIRVTGSWEVEQSVGGRQGAAGQTEIVTVTDSVTLKVKQVGEEKYLEVMLPKQAPHGKNIGEDRAQINWTYVGSSKENAKKQFNHVKQAIAAAPANDQPEIHYSYARSHIGTMPDASAGAAEDEDSLTNLVNVDDGVWYDFGYYGNGDDDALINGMDDDSAVVSYDLVDIPTAAGLPEGAVLDTVHDFGMGTHTFGAQDVRIVTYTGPVSGDGIAKVIDMTEGSSTYGQAIQTLLSPSDGSVELYLGDDDVAAQTISSDVIAQMKAENDARRLDDGPSNLMTGVVADLEAEGIGAENIIEEYDDAHLAYVTYEGSDGTLQVRYRHQPSFMSMMADPGEFVADQVIGGTLTDGDEGFVKLQEATEALEGYYASSDIRQNATNGASIGGKAGGLIGGSLGVLFGATTSGPLGVAVFGAVGGAAGWIAGSAIGGIANVVVGGTRALYHGLQSASLLGELDDLAGSPVSDSPTGGTVAATDPGVLGTTYAAYWYPQDATIISNDTLLAEDGPYGVDTKQYVYIRGDDPSTIYSAAVDISDPESARHGLVLHATATDWDEQPDGTILSDVTVYDSTGNALETVEDLDLPSVSTPLEEDDILGHPADFLAHAEEKLPDDAVIQKSDSAGPATYIEYTIPGVQGTKVLTMLASKNDNGTIHSENSTSWVNSSTYEDFKKGFGYFQEAARGLLDLKMEYDGASIAASILQYMYQNIDINAIGAMVGGAARPQDMGPQGAATTLMTATVAGLLPYAQQAMGLGIQWAALHQVPSSIAMGGICMSRAMGQTATTAPVQGETGDIEDQVVEDNPNADEVDPPEEFRRENFKYFEAEMDMWIEAKTGTQIAKDLDTNTFAALDMPYWVMGEIERVVRERDAPDVQTYRSKDYHIDGNRELNEKFSQLMQQTVDENIADGKMPEGAYATVEDGKHFIRNFTPTGATHSHQDVFPSLVNEEGHELVGVYTILTTTNKGHPTQVLNPDHRDKVMRNPDFIPRMEMEEWIAIDGGSMDRYMTWSDTPELLIFEGRPDADLKTQYESLVHRSPPDEFDRTIYEIKVAVYAPRR